MRTFIVSLFIFVIVITVIIINGSYINSITEDMIKDTLSLPDDFENYDNTLKKINSLSKQWEKHHALISISVGGKYLNNVKKDLSDMKSHYECRSDNDYIASKRQLIYDLRELHNLESFSLHSIF